MLNGWRYTFGGTCCHCSEHHHSSGDRELSLYNSEESTTIYASPVPIWSFSEVCPWGWSGLQAWICRLLIIVSISQDLLWDLAASQISPRDLRLSTLGLPVFGFLAISCPVDWLSFCPLFWGSELRSHTLKSLVLVLESELGFEFRDLSHPEWI